MYKAWKHPCHRYFTSTLRLSLFPVFHNSLFASPPLLIWEAGTANHLTMKHIFHDTPTTFTAFSTFSTFFSNPIRAIHCLTSTIELISQDVLYYHSSRPCPLSSIPHPFTIIDHLLLHRQWYSNLTRFLNSHCVDNYCYIHPGRLYDDPYASSRDRNTYFYRHSPRSRNLID